MGELTDKVILVTGATRGIGLGITRVLAREGARGVPEHERQNTGGYGHSEGPTEFESSVEIGNGHEHSQQPACEHGPQGQLPLGIAPALVRPSVPPARVVVPT